VRLILRACSSRTRSRDRKRASRDAEEPGVAGVFVVPDHGHYDRADVALIRK
jgi:hypothetical protein